jgi:hypothetical protein
MSIVEKCGSVNYNGALHFGKFERPFAFRHNGNFTEEIQAALKTNLLFLEELPVHLAQSKLWTHEFKHDDRDIKLVFILHDQYARNVAGIECLDRDILYQVATNFVEMNKDFLAQLLLTKN